MLPCFHIVAISRPSTFAIWVIYLVMISSAIRFQSEFCFLICVSSVNPVRQFFSGPLKQFERTKTWKSASGKKMTGLVEDDTIEAIGEGMPLVIHLIVSILT